MKSGSPRPASVRGAGGEGRSQVRSPKDDVRTRCLSCLRLLTSLFNRPPHPQPFYATKPGEKGASARFVDANANVPSKCGHVRHAFTLLEVVLGLTLLATVLAGSLLSFTAHRRQLALADKRIAAVNIAEQLLSNSLRLPRSMIGPVPGQPTWYWQTSVVGVTKPLDAPLVVVRLNIVERQPGGKQQVLTSVDVVEPMT